MVHLIPSKCRKSFCSFCFIYVVIKNPLLETFEGKLYTLLKIFENRKGFVQRLIFYSILRTYITGNNYDGLIMKITFFQSL